MPRQQLIYASRPRGFDQPVLRAILAVSRDMNAEHDVTGALICRSDIYLQLLEGPGAAIERLYANICRDQRHEDVTLLVRAKIEDRLFPDWSMWHDPEKSWLWSPEEVRTGAIVNAGVLEVREVFVRAANQPVS